MPHFVEVKGLQVGFSTKLGEIRAVDGVDYTIDRGSVLGVVGESGCGKSVTSYAMMGLLPSNGRITSGEIFIDGQDVARFSERDFTAYRGKKIAMIFQEPMTALNPVLTVGTQIAEQMVRHLGLSREDAKDRAIELLDRVGISAPHKRINEYPHQLSGGMKQRVMIAMAISCNPDLLISDEPTTALDVTVQAQILELICELQEEMGMTVQFITHDLGVISQIADTVNIMYMGKVVESGRCSDIFTSPKHPYTKGLIESIPRFGRPVDKLQTIEGSVPSLLERPQGCAFRNRCYKATDQCESAPPREFSNSDHSYHCYYPEVVGSSY